MKIAVIPNLSRDGGGQLAKKIAAEIARLGGTPIVSSEIDCDFERASYPEIYKNADIIIAVGGDGTILHTAKHASEFGKPILGINAGRLGFMAGLEADELNGLKALLAGKFEVEKRMMLKAKTEDGRSFFCLNDAVITKGVLSRVIDISMLLCGQELTYRADGLIFSTPTGSTAYSVSAGGPLVDPAVQCILVTPICPHALSSRAMILERGMTIEVCAHATDDTDVFLTIDGETAVGVNGKKVIISAADQYVDLIKIKEDSFYSMLKAKLL